MEFRIDDPGRFFRATGYGVLTRHVILEFLRMSVDFRIGAHLYPSDLTGLDVGLIPDDQRAPFLGLLARSRAEPPDCDTVLQFCPASGVRRPEAFRVLFTMTERDDWRERYPGWFDVLEQEIDLIVVPTDWNRRLFSEHGVTTPIEVCPLGVDSDLFRPADPPPPAEPFTFLAVFQGLGQSSSREDWEDLLTAWGRAFGPNDPVRLLIKSAHVDRRRTVLQKGAPVEVLDDEVGLVREQEMAELYRSTHAFVKSSVEGWGLPTMEAMASGLPLIHSRGTAPDSYLDDDNAFLFERGDADTLARLLRRVFEEREAETVVARSVAARNTAQRYGWASAAARLLEIMRGARRTEAQAGARGTSARGESGPLKLEIGAGEKPQAGYVHHDIRELPGIDVVCDARSFPAEHHGRYEEVYASNILEHFSRFEVRQVIVEWVRLLRPGGVLKLIVPDVREIARQLISGYIDIAWFNYLLYGGNDYDLNIHRYGFDCEHLVRMVGEAGCEVVKVIPSRTWENRRLDKYCPMITVWGRKPDAVSTDDP